MQNLINAVTAEEIRKCFQVKNWLNSQIYYEIWLDEHTKYTVTFQDFSFFCTCGTEDCKHPLWCIATAREIKRIAKLNPANITITKTSGLQFLQMIYVNDGHCVFHHVEQGEYRCGCPFARSNRLNLVNVDCAHETAVKRENNK